MMAVQFCRRWAAQIWMVMAIMCCAGIILEVENNYCEYAIFTFSQTLVVVVVVVATNSRNINRRVRCSFERRSRN